MRYTICLFLVTFFSTACLNKSGGQDTGVEPVDADADGHTEDVDCDDADASINPEADELCNGVDDNCDDVIDTDAVDAATWYADTDGDGYGDAEVTELACEAPSGFVEDATDCDDAVAGVNPEVEEVCDGIDNDCNTLVDESSAVDALSWYADQDGDGFGDPGSGELACETPGAGYLSDNTDCDDTASAIFPGAEETCDGLDNNCDSVVDEDAATDALVFYADTDADGYGDVTVTTLACVAPTGFVADGTDCDDAVAAVNPGADELCSTVGVDDDCDGDVDEPDAADVPQWQPDMDADGFGSSINSLSACDGPTWLLPVNTGIITVGEVFGYDPESISLVESVSENCTLDSLSVDVNISHAWSGDIQLDLVSPAGTSVRIRYSTGSNVQNLIGTFTDDGTGIDPDEPLSAFSGESSRGDWTIVAQDLVPVYDDGLFNSWGLNFTCTGASVTDNTDCDDYDEAVYPGSGCP